MAMSNRFSHHPPRLVVGVLFVVFGGLLHAGPAAPDKPAATSPPALIGAMAGTWDVQQRMWPAADAKAVELPAATARRRILPGGFLEETMEPATPGAKDAFVRTAYFNYNPVSGQYEYFSLDSRAPQMMNERSARLAADHATGPDGLSLAGSRFVAAQWGDQKNVAFTYRLQVGKVVEDKQLVRLYLTPQAEAGAKEFLAFEYVYTRRR